jgi:hypothetical protein
VPALYYEFYRIACCKDKLIFVPDLTDKMIFVSFAEAAQLFETDNPWPSAFVSDPVT